MIIHYRITMTDLIKSRHYLKFQLTTPRSPTGYPDHYKLTQKLDEGRRSRKSTDILMSIDDLRFTIVIK